MFDAVVGVDPGSKGCAALITKDQELFFCRFMRYENRQKAFYDWLFSYSLIYNITGAREYVHAIKGKDKDIKDIFAFGENNGDVRTVLAICSIPTVLVRPGEWQRFNKVAGRHAPLGSTPDKETGAKMRAYQSMARSLFASEQADSITQDAGAGILIANWIWWKTFG